MGCQASRPPLVDLQGQRGQGIQVVGGAHLRGMGFQVFDGSCRHRKRSFYGLLGEEASQNKTASP